MKIVGAFGVRLSAPSGLTVGPRDLRREVGKAALWLDFQRPVRAIIQWLAIELVCQPASHVRRGHGLNHESPGVKLRPCSEYKFHPISPTSNSHRPENDLSQSLRHCGR